MNAVSRIFRQSLLLLDDADKTLAALGYRPQQLDALVEYLLARPSVQEWTMRYTWPQLVELAERIAMEPDLQEVFKDAPPAEMERLTVAMSQWLLHLKASDLCNDILHHTPDEGGRSR